MHSWAVVVAGPGRQVSPHVVERLEAIGEADLPLPVDRSDRWWSRDRQTLVAGWSADVDGRSGGGSSQVGAGGWSVGDGAADGAVDGTVDGAVTVFGGHLWFGDEPWSASTPVAEQVAMRCAGFDVDADAEHLTGVFTLVHVRDDGTGWITADPLGLGMVYRAEGAGVTVLANRASVAARLSAAPGVEPARDVTAMGMLALTGSMQDRRTGFVGVEVIPQASVVHLEPRHEPHMGSHRGSQRGVRVEVWSRLPWWSGESLSLDDATELARDRLRRRVRLLASTGAGTVCELTGGKDSRLVLALLLAEGLAGDVEARTWGGADLPDVIVATSLAERYGLDHRVDGRLTSRSGRNRSRRQNGPTGSNRSAGSTGRVHRRTIAPLGFEDQIRHHLWATSGAQSLWNLHRPTWPPTTGLSLTGLAGEVLSTNHTDTNRIRTTGDLRRFVHRGGFGFDAAGIIDRGVVGELREVLIREILAARPDGGDLLDAVDGFYQRGRLRRWAGTSAELDVRNRVFPLYDLAAMRAAFAIGSDARRADWLKFRLIEACAPELVTIPFADDGWGAQIVRGRPDLGLPAPSARWAIPLPVEVALRPLRQRLHRATVPIVADLARRRRPAPSAAERGRMDDIDHKRTALRGLLDRPAGDPTWDLFDRRRTLRALDRIETLPSQARAELHHAATVAGWLGHADHRADLFDG